MDNRLLNLTQIAAYLSVHPKTIYKWIRRGRFPKPIKVWGSPRWDLDEVLQYLQVDHENQKKVAIGSL